ncbi:MAG TPA: hypothetical protein VHU86_04380 [Solirubrobacterales bacterium]|jgi:hypothetical protein|nr:hypothetical protein [Solirubrobacterales bacterium]
MVAMDSLPRVRLSGAPAYSGEQPKVTALRKTSTACPSQWEGTLEDGRAVYARYRYGHLSVGAGDDIDEAVRNSTSDQALYADYAGDGLDGFMEFEELLIHLHGLLEFPADLVVENENPPPPDREALKRPLRPRQAD